MRLMDERVGLDGFEHHTPTSTALMELETPCLPAYVDAAFRQIA